MIAHKPPALGSITYLDVLSQLGVEAENPEADPVSHPAPHLLLLRLSPVDLHVVLPACFSLAGLMPPQFVCSFLWGTPLASMGSPVCSDKAELHGCTAPSLSGLGRCPTWLILLDRSCLLPLLL